MNRTPTYAPNPALRLTLAGCAAFVLLLAGPARAKNVDLVTLPDRQSVALTIYNSEDLTLVRETRYVTLKRGSNRLQLSWANTLIDPTSVELRPLQHQDRIEIAATIFPGQKPQHLIWDIESELEGQVKVEVSYFTSGLTWKMDYEATCDPAETRMKLRGYVRVFNRSGEDYEGAEVRLIVGKINLVEKIAELARRQGVPTPKPAGPRFDRMRREAVQLAIGRAGDAARDFRSQQRPKQIVKEGLSEYFMFSIEGTETIRNGWSKRMVAVRADDTPFDIVYRMRGYQYGPRPVRFFIWKNDEEHHLGESPLPDGQVRVFRENGRDGLSFLGEQRLLYVPVKAPIEVNLGPDDLVFHYARTGGVTRQSFSFNRRSHVTGWDEHRRWTQTVRNFRTKPITVELRLQLTGDIELSTDRDAKAFDFRTVEIKLAVPARDKVAVNLRAAIHLGSNQKQSRIRLDKTR